MCINITKKQANDINYLNTYLQINENLEEFIKDINTNGILTLILLYGMCEIESYTKKIENCIKYMFDIKFNFKKVITKMVPENNFELIYKQLICISKGNREEFKSVCEQIKTMAN